MRRKPLNHHCWPPSRLLLLCLCDGLDRHHDHPHGLVKLYTRSTPIHCCCTHHCLEGIWMNPLLISRGELISLGIGVFRPFLDISALEILLLFYLSPCLLHKYKAVFG